MKVVFFGTPQFAADVLTFLLEKGVQISAVITKPDKPKGRSGHPLPTPVKLVAQAHAIPYFQPEIVSDLNFAPTLAQFEADLFVVVAFGEIIKQHLLDMPKLGCINLHASLLPKYRGAAPIQRCIINGEKNTGITIMHMVKKMDAGDMIKQVTVPIPEQANFVEIEHALCLAGAQALFDVITQFEKGSVSATPQDHSQATYAAKIELEDCQIDWNKSAEEIHNLVRGVYPEPGAWCFVTVKEQKKRLKIFSTKVVKNRAGKPGEIGSYGKDGLIVCAGKDAIQILTLQLEGKKAMSAEELMRGVSKDNIKF